MIWSIHGFRSRVAGDRGEATDTAGAGGGGVTGSCPRAQFTLMAKHTTAVVIARMPVHGAASYRVLTPVDYMVTYYEGVRCFSPATHTSKPARTVKKRDVGALEAVPMTRSAS